MPYVPTIAVDFDGTLASGNNFPDIGEPNPGARETLEYFKSLGYHILIWSCRTCHWHYDTFGGDPTQYTLERIPVLKMIEWLHAHKIPYDAIDDGSKGKPTADVYIDDKAVQYIPEETGWEDVRKEVDERRKKGPANHGKIKQ
jgi:hypothetical protein